MLSQDILQLAYLLHDTAYEATTCEDRAKEMLRLMNDRGWVFVKATDMNDMYRQGQIDALQQDLSPHDI